MREKKIASGGNRRRWSAAEKLRIVLSGMEPGVEVSDVCRREGSEPDDVLPVEANAAGSGREDIREQGCEADGMDGHSVSLAGQAALETLPRAAGGELLVRPRSAATTGAATSPKSSTACWSTTG